MGTEEEVGSLVALERSTWWVTGLALALGIANPFLGWLSGVWAVMPFAVAVLGLATIWQLRRMPEALRQTMDRATGKEASRRGLIDTFLITAFVIAMAFTSLPIWAILVAIAPYLVLIGVREYVLAKRRLEGDGKDARVRGT
jgi:hypothetical protein